MTVLVDTPVWSFAYRRRKRSRAEQAIVDSLTILIRGERAVLIGPVRQEVLSGIGDPKQFDAVRTTLRGFAELPLTTRTYEDAAALDNRCRRQGVQGSPIDFLLCAASLDYDAPVFTTDGDFARYAKLARVRLYQQVSK